ncbi:YpzG family protein [Lederbergia lenta]|uniref:YpzG family protein n=1 Tax=Lederbergia lenta TaxID=1467 RepID=A0A2X4WDF8_LEDLE|nr:YpzG family protein [Lederbergia lenta]MCM3113380.1 YpzG family protein [Lederbergia lenta]MEC2326475.1 YpzG family protein [Lederbergia lenta]SQI61201.1 Uncharacterised protein [Lederbergia lenta]
MANNENSHLNRQLTPFNRAWFSPKNMSSQVNGHTQLTQDDIIRQRAAVTKYKK